MSTSAGLVANSHLLLRYEVHVLYYGLPRVIFIDLQVA